MREQLAEADSVVDTRTMQTLISWVEEHADLVTKIVSTCRTIFMPKGVVCYPLIGEDVQPLVEELGISPDKLTVKIDGYEITLHFQ